MPCAVDFLPSYISEFTNFVTSVELYTGSSSVSRLDRCPFLGMFPLLLFLLLLLLETRNLKLETASLRLRPLAPILRPPLLPVRNSCGIKGAAHYVIADTA